MFLIEVGSGVGGQIFLHPEQAVMRPMDGAFADTFRQAASALAEFCSSADMGMPKSASACLYGSTGQERFLQGLLLSGGSGAGALALGAYRAVHRHPAADLDMAVSFALSAPGMTGSLEMDGDCHSVVGMDDKVRGCARYGVRRLLVAREQESALALYGRRHQIRIIGVETVAAAIALICSTAKPREASHHGVISETPPHSIPSEAYLQSQKDHGVVPHWFEVLHRTATGSAFQPRTGAADDDRSG